MSLVLILQVAAYALVATLATEGVQHFLVFKTDAHKDTQRQVANIQSNSA